MIIRYTELNGDYHAVLCDFLGSGSACNAYSFDGGVYLVVNPADRISKDILVGLQGLPHIPKMEFLGITNEDKAVYLTEYSETIWNKSDKRISHLSSSFDTEDEFQMTRIREFMDNPYIPQTMKDSARKIFDMAYEYTQHFTYDFRPANIGISPSGEILLRDIVYFSN